MLGSIWLVQAGERLPLDGDPRIMRMGMIAEELNHRGYEIHWFAARFDHAKKLQRPGDSTQEIKTRYFIHLLNGCSYRSNISLLRIIHQFQVARAFRKEARKLRPPCLIISAHPTPDLSATSASLAKELGVPMILDIRDPWPDMFPGYFSRLKQLLIQPLLFFYRRLLKRAAKRADAIFAVSQAMLEWGLKYAERPKSRKDRVLHIGYQESSKRSFPNESEHSRKGPIECVFVSTFGQSYDAETVINAFKLLDPSYSEQIRCTFVGDGERREAMEALAKGVKSVVFTGWLGGEALSELLGRMNVGIIAVRGGITDFMLPNKLFEYLSYGLAIVNTLPCEAAEIIKQSECGATVQAGNAEQMADVLRQWANNPGRVKAFQSQSLKVFRSRFVADAIYREYAEEAESLIRGEVKNEAEHI